MANLEIVPFKSVGPINFGMTRDEVRRVMSEPAEPFRKNMFSLTDTDEFPKARVHVFYEAKNDTVEAVEIWQPAKPTLGGATLLDQPYQRLRAEFLATDPDLIEKTPGDLRSDRLGVCAWAPTADSEPQRPPRSVLAFCRGYWDNYEEMRQNALLHLMKQLGEQ